MDKLLLIGVNHKVAPAALREKLSFNNENVIQADRLLRSKLSSNSTCRESGDDVEVALLSTCNRTEVVLRASDPSESEEIVRGFFSKAGSISNEALVEVLYVYQGCEAVQHLLRVSTGLDSLVVGENEIQGQVRHAYELAQTAGTAGPILNTLFRTAVQAGKRVRSETEIGKTKLSVATLVVDLAEEYLGDLQEHTALLVGAGKISTLTARQLVRAGLRCVLIANRTFQRAQKLAQNLGEQFANAVHFDLLNENLAAADIVICSTSAPHIVLHEKAVMQAMEERAGRPLLVVDLAIPRDADPRIGDLPDVEYFAIDDLSGLVQERYTLTANALSEAESIIEEESSRFAVWCEARQVTPLIRSLRAKADTIVQAEIERTLQRMGPLTSEQQAAIEYFGHAIVNKLLHDPTICLKNKPDMIQHSETLELVQALFWPGTSPQ